MMPLASIHEYQNWRNSIRSSSPVHGALSETALRRLFLQHRSGELEIQHHHLQHRPMESHQSQQERRAERKARAGEERVPAARSGLFSFTMVHTAVIECICKKTTGINKDSRSETGEITTEWVFFPLGAISSKSPPRTHHTPPHHGSVVRLVARRMRRAPGE